MGFILDSIGSIIGGVAQAVTTVQLIAQEYGNAQLTSDTKRLKTIINEISNMVNSNNKITNDTINRLNTLMNNISSQVNMIDGRLAGRLNAKVQDLQNKVNKYNSDINNNNNILTKAANLESTLAANSQSATTYGLRNLGNKIFSQETEGDKAVEAANELKNQIGGAQYETSIQESK